MTVASRATYLLGSTAAALALGLAARPADACSICRCGDATFNALGKDVTSEPGWRFAFDMDRFSKTQGPPEAQDSIVEDRYTAVGAYTLGNRALLVARVPYAERWLDEHVQPGTGSTDPFFGVSGYYLLNTKSSLFASVQRRLPGANDFGYQYGDISLVNFAYERKLTPKLDSVLELNYRYSGRDRIDDAGAIDPDTGGRILYLTPRVLVNVGGVVLRFAAQIPVAESLYGVQDEKPVYNVGFTRSFGK